MKLPLVAFDYRKFSDAIDQLSRAPLNEIHCRVVAAMLEKYGVDVSGLVFEMTNVITYVDSVNDRNTIAREAHCKQKRHDLRIVGLSHRDARRGHSRGRSRLLGKPARRHPVRHCA